MKSYQKMSLVFGIMVLFAIIMFFIGLYYNLRPGVTSLIILIPVVLIAIITFADLEKERYFSQREGGDYSFYLPSLSYNVICIFCCLSKRF